MDQAVVAAEEALDAAVALCVASGLAGCLEELVQDIYGSNLARHEPEELGDTAMTLGTQCVENLKTRAVRRAAHDDLELAENHWHVEGLQVVTPSNVLTILLPRTRIVGMKVPYGQGRAPQWDRLGDWSHDSHVRQAWAAANSRRLLYRTHLPADDPLFPLTTTPGVVQNFMLVWAGEPWDARTAGWLTVPTEGDTPFIARRRLWWDEEPTPRLSTTTKPTEGPSFDERQAAAPQVTLKPRPAAEDLS